MIIRILKLTVVASVFTAGGALADGKPATEEVPSNFGETVTGPLEKDVVRKAIEQHISEVKNCYEPELKKNERLAGRVLTSFTIGKDGKVTAPKVEQSTLGNPSVEKCIVGAVSLWDFPKPKGDKVVVTFPFVLRSAG